MSSGTVAANQHLLLAQRLRRLDIAPAAVAAGLGKFMPDAYRETEWMLPQDRDENPVTLLALAWLAPTLAAFVLVKAATTSLALLTKTALALRADLQDSRGTGGSTSGG